MTSSILRLLNNNNSVEDTVASRRLVKIRLIISTFSNYNEHFRMCKWSSIWTDSHRKRGIHCAWNGALQPNKCMAIKHQHNSKHCTVGEKGRYLIQSYNKSPYTHRKIQKATWQHGKYHQIVRLHNGVRTDLRLSVGVTAVTPMVWLNRFTSAQPSHSLQKKCNQSYIARLKI